MSLSYGDGVDPSTGGTAEQTLLSAVAETDADPFPLLRPTIHKSVLHVASSEVVFLTSCKIRVKYTKYLEKDRRISAEIKHTSATRNH